MAEAMRVEAASLLRVSTFVQARDGTSLESQDEKNAEFIERNGWHLHDRYVEEEGVSGRAAQRDDVARLLADVRAGRVHVVVVNKVDRLVRDERQFHNIIGEIEAAGALFVSATEGFDPATSSGRATRSILAWAASFERDRIVERTWEGTRKTAERGYWPGGTPTYGLRAVTVEGTKHKALDVDDGEAALLRLAAALIADEGCTPTEAADRVNGLGHRTRTGRPWSATALRRVLSADGLCGTFTFAGAKRGRANKGAAIVIPVPAVFTPERRAEVMAALAETYRPVAAKALYPLSGRLVAACGEKYRGSNKSAFDLRQYRCMGHERTPRCGCANLHGEQVEAAVWEAVRGLLADPERLLSMVREYLERRGQQMTAERDQLATIDAKIAAHERAVKRTLVEYALQGLPADAVRAATDELQRELGALRRHRAQVRQWQVANLSDSERMRKLWEVADLAHTRLATMTAEERARVLALLHVRVTVLGADACPDCGGTGKLPGRRGGYRCERCRGLARIARCRIEGTLIDRFTDAVSEAGDEPTGAVRDFANTGRDDAYGHERAQNRWWGVRRRRYGRLPPALARPSRPP